MENQKDNQKDFLDGDHSAKNWFKIMWQNNYIQLVLLAIAFIVALFIYKDEFDSLWSFLLCLAIPVAMIVIIVCLGFIRFWNDLKNGRSR